MNDSKERFDQARDPLGLRDLPEIEPDFDGWPEIRAALESGSRWSATPTLRWLAAAAVVVLAVTVSVVRMERPAAVSVDPAPAQAVVQQETRDPALQTVDSLIALSQTLEGQVRELRESTGGMPAESAMYVTELLDLVAQVDEQISYSPDSVHLWGQRVNLLLDLAQIYQHQWELDYGRMASL